METYSTRQNKVSRLIRILKYLYTLKQLNSRELLLTTKYHRNQDAKANSAKLFHDRIMKLLKKYENK